jgi:ATP-dependent helicase/nuclease subunit B
MEWAVPSGGTLSLRGRVDRVDVLGRNIDGRPRVWIEDYKRGQPRFKLDRVMAGFDLQLPLYLMVASRATEGVPAGMTYAALRPERPRSRHREELPEGFSHQHRGRFDWELVRDAAGGMPAWERLPFRFKLKKDGMPSFDSDGVAASSLKDILRVAAARAAELASEMLGGDISVAPIPDGAKLPCDSCPYRGVCRVGAGL